MSESVFSDSIPELLSNHLRHLQEDSGLSLEVIRERGYRSLLGRSELEKLGFAKTQQRTPGILIPLWGVDGKQAGYQYRPDNPRLSQKGRPIKYENPYGSGIHLDCPPCCHKLLGDPRIPLWITEGCKKADALATRGACAISLTGVWGFKGKNELGGVVFLADWDYIALKDRAVYLTFDSDVVTKEPVKKALERLAEHLQRRGARVSAIYLPQQGELKVGIDDYLLEHSLEDAQKLAADLDSKSLKAIEYSVPGFVLPDGIIGEMVIGDKDERYFILYSAGSVGKALQYQTDKITYIPTADPLVGQVVHFASTARPYDSQAALFNQIKTFIHRYIELPPDFEDIATLYVLLTWVFEFAPSIPYLRVIGDWGSGKTRFLQVVGSICFRPIFASGATTPAPIFRILDKFQGTLVLDEADFKDSSSWVEMVKILNNGYRPGFPVLRADKEDGKWYPRGYRVFGPKLIATRSPFKDEALESRCLTTEMMPLTRQDIPRLLPPSFAAEVDNLRSQLLTFRLGNLLKLKGRTFGNDLLEPNLQPRLQEILIPLKAMVDGDDSLVQSLALFIHRLQETLFTRRRENPAGRVLAAMIELHEQGEELSSKNIADKVSEMDEDALPLSPEKVGWLTRRLGFEKEKNSSNKRRVICWDDNRITRLASQYGLNFEIPISTEKPSEPSKPSNLAITSNTDGFPTTPEILSHKPSIAGFISVADGLDGLDSITEDKGYNKTTQTLGMTVEQAIDLWRQEGSPVIHLGPGEDCVGLEKLLSHSDINPRHLLAVKGWLQQHRSPAPFQDGPA